MKPTSYKSRLAIGLSIVGVLLLGSVIDHRPTVVAAQSEQTMSRDKLDSLIKAKTVAEGFGMTAQQYYAYETAADKAGITPEQWYGSMVQFTRRMTELKRRGSSYLFNRLYSQGAGRYLASVSAGNTTTVQALEQSLDAIQTLKAGSNPSVAAMFADEIGLGTAGTVLKREDVDSEMPHLAHLTDEYFAQAKKARDAMIDADRR
jgi:hypothetical protein